MRQYDIVVGILLILSIIDFALAAPVLMRAKSQARVGVVRMPKDVIAVLGKRVGEDLEKVAADFEKMISPGPAESSDAHAPSSPAPVGQDHGSTDVVQAAAPNPVSSTANPDSLVGPSSPSVAPVSGLWEDHYNAAWDDSMSNKASDGSNEPWWTPTHSEYGSDDELNWGQPPKSDRIPVPNPRPGQSTDPDNFDWAYWDSVVNHSPPKVYPDPGPSDAGPSTSAIPDGPDPNFDWAGWLSDVNKPPPEGHAYLYYPDAGKSTGKGPDLNWNDGADEANSLALPPLKIMTNPDKHPDLTAVDQPPPSPLSQMGFDEDHGVSLPPSFAQSAEDAHEYQYQFPDEISGLVTPPSSPGAWLPTVPEHELAPQSPDAWSPKAPENEVVTPSSPYSQEGSDSESEYEMKPTVPLVLEPLKEPGQEVIPGPLASPNTEFNMDDSTLSRPVDPPALMYGIKGKGKAPEWAPQNSESEVN